MKDDFPFTLDSFYRFVGEKKLMAAKCKQCGKMLLPPRPMCSKCFSTDLEWIELAKRGKLMTYTVIYVPLPQFDSKAPYAVGIVKLLDGLKLPGIIRDATPEVIKVGMDLKVDFDTKIPSTWPMWPRYFFTPA